MEMCLRTDGLIGMCFKCKRGMRRVSTGARHAPEGPQAVAPRPRAWAARSGSAPALPVAGSGRRM